ncbi:putative pheromone P-factor (Map2) [Aspergillus fischeri NRRL 181]|uniref:Pheromone P-factor (Map2), putative n=1 Tax=Neosartorya fischeri (strain ATCC 1020 / DSM 3700 / CBS 544.65 / FGSC A1164 / JCM 1740 / NRRL 181 / WB 181) TaxID=331117 RepID=A1DH75_NEOFI|nr:pheromone P-factor (Map2), putative [Aspergillus fischeri NRRL 181]EAW18732.1 pheromone P-factor (Map2), putative [Aspergillus fischeri NRRL 181]
MVKSSTVVITLLVAMAAAAPIPVSLPCYIRSSSSVLTDSSKLADRGEEYSLPLER